MAFFWERTVSIGEIDGGFHYREKIVSVGEMEHFVVD